MNLGSSEVLQHTMPLHLLIATWPSFLGPFRGSAKKKSASTRYPPCWWPRPVLADWPVAPRLQRQSPLPQHLHCRGRRYPSPATHGNRVCHMPEAPRAPNKSASLTSSVPCGVHIGQVEGVSLINILLFAHAMAQKGIICIHLAAQMNPHLTKEKNIINKQHKHGVNDNLVPDIWWTPSRGNACPPATFEVVPALETRSQISASTTMASSPCMSKAPNWRRTSACPGRCWRAVPISNAPPEPGKTAGLGVG